jgi:adenine-specific DNA-methyltransferase
MIAVSPTSSPRLHHPRRHAAVRTRDYVFAQLIPYIGNKRKLLHLIADAVQLTGCDGGTFVDLFAGSTVVARWAKRSGFRVVTNDWEPYSHAIAHGTVMLNRPPAFGSFGGPACAFERMNRLPPIDDYVATHLCPADDDDPDPQRERMFFTRANGRRIDAIREQLAVWRNSGMIDDDELNYALASLVYAASYASNTSGVFKGFHHGWGGKTGTALYRIRGQLAMQPPVLFDNGQDNMALRDDAQQLAGRLSRVAGGKPDIAYIDPPYNQHPYGSNYHVLNTITLWDKPPVNQSILVDGKPTNKSAIRTDWRTERRSPYNDRRAALDAFADLVYQLDARYALVSYSSDGNMPLEQMLRILADRGALRVLTERYKRYRVSTPRMSSKSHNVEFVAVVDLTARPTPQRVASIADDIRCRDSA